MVLPLIRRSCYWIMAAIVLTSPSVSSQNLYTAFGPVSEISVGGTIAGALSGDFNADGFSDVGVFGAHHLTLFLASPGGSYTPTTLRVQERVVKAVVGDCNRDGFSDIVLLTSNPPSLVVLMARRDTFRQEWTSELSFQPENILLVDVNFDKNLDILLYGKKHLGVSVLYGIGNGRYNPPRTFFEDYSFTDVLCHDFNGDRIMDYICYDWVRNELLLFSAIGPSRFSSPSSLHLPSELTDVGVTFINNDGDPDLVVLYQSARELRTYVGDGLGNFIEEGVIALPCVPTMVLVVDVNGDRKDDIVVFSEIERGFFVYINEGEKISTSNVSYSAGIKPAEILVSRSARERIGKLTVVDRLHRSMIVFNDYLYSYITPSGQTYGLGIQPQSLVAFDANRNGLPDFIVANTHSEHLSLFLNRGDGTFYGQIPLLSERYAETVSAVWKDNATFVCVTEHPSVDKIVLTEVSYPNFETSVWSIPTSPNIELYSASYDTSSRLWKFLVLSKEASGVILYEIVCLDHGKNTVERTIFRLEGNDILGVQISDVNDDGRLDALFVKRDERRGGSSLHVSLGGSDGDLLDSQVMYSLPDTGIRDVRLKCIDLDGDTATDLLIQYHAHDDYLGLSYGKGDGTFAPLHTRFPQVVIRSSRDVDHVDVTGDGVKDLILANALTKTLQVFEGRGRGQYSKPTRLLTYPSGGSFVARDFNNDSIPDYAVLYSDPGMLKVFLGRE